MRPNPQAAGATKSLIKKSCQVAGDATQHVLWRCQRQRMVRPNEILGSVCSLKLLSDLIEMVREWAEIP